MGVGGFHIRAGPCTGGHGAPEKGGSYAQGLGRSRGGLSTKIHAAVDALGLPVKLILGPGHRNDILYAEALLEETAPAYVIADRAYDAGYFYTALQTKGAIAVIPPRDAHRRHHPGYDTHIYKERNLVERFFNKLKHFRRVATRYDKLAQTYLGFVLIAAIIIWLK